MSVQTKTKKESNMVQATNRMVRFVEINYVLENPFVSSDLVRLVMGDKIGHGAYRTVYEFPLRKNTVIKVAADYETSNLLEWAVWQAVKNTPYKKWFAPCMEISRCGHFLLQKRIKPIKAGDKLPKKIPAVFNDIKKENWGWIGKQLVCHDYQSIDRAYDFAFNVNMKEVNWQQ
jgi:hypothetical protein